MDKKNVKVINVDASLDSKIKSYALAKGLTQSEVLRRLIEQGLACNSRKYVRYTTKPFRTKNGALGRFSQKLIR